MSNDVNAIVSAILAKAPRGARIAFVSGDFNVIHPGHQRILNFAATCGDFLVVGVNGDGLGNTMVPQELRREGVAALSVVDVAVCMSIPAQDFIAHLKPAVVVKGTEYRSRFNVEQGVVDDYGGKLLFCSGDTSYSSLDLLRHELQDTDFSAIRKPMDFPQRHGFGIARLIDHVRAFPSLHVVVVGDLIVDEYIDCDPLGMSREDPTLVVTPILSKRFVGGAGIVAAHARGLGARVSYFGIAANDDTARFAADVLKEYGVDHHLLPEESRPTTLKQRYRAANKTLLRVSHLRQHEIGECDRLAVERIAHHEEGQLELAVRVALLGQLLHRRVDLAAREVVDLQALDDLVVAVLGGHRERGDQALGDAEFQRVDLQQAFLQQEA